MPVSHPLITLLGVTASGKTSLSIELAERLNAEIICADSRTIYQGLDIGTAKPSMADQERVRHHLVDICQPNERFSAQDFTRLAEAALKDIRSRGKIALIVGGSGLYIDALLFGYQFRTATDVSEQDIQALTDDQLLHAVRRRYPEAVLDIDIANRRRLEQLLLRGPAGTADRRTLKHDGLLLGLKIERPDLENNIVKRTTWMIEHGMVPETQDILKEYGPDIPALQTTGYKSVVAMLKGELPESELEAAIVRETLQLAKKQATWFRRNTFIEWLGTKIAIEARVANYLKG